LYRQISPHISKGKYALYGHSLGGLLGCLLCRKLSKHNQHLPAHIFITGTAGPSAASREEKKRHLMERAEFLDEIKKLKGSPEEVLNNAELLEYFEPILRADFEVSETYVYEKDEAPLNIPFTVITGTEEDMEEADIKTWQHETTMEVDFRRLDGGHFFILDHSSQILEVISSKVNEAILNP